MSDDEIDRLVADGTVRRVAPDAGAAARELAMAQQHIASSELLVESDPAGALVLAYDAARKAIEAHMRSHGLRTGRGEGGHAKLVRYGLGAFGTSAGAPHFEMFDRVRRVRNSVQYDAFMVEDADVRFALDHAKAIVRTVADELR